MPDNEIRSSRATPHIIPVSGFTPSDENPSTAQQQPLSPSISPSGRQINSSTSPRASAMQRVQARWNRLKATATRFQQEGTYSDLREVLDDPGNKPILGVQNTLIAAFTHPITQAKKFINANRITLSHQPTATSEIESGRTYVVGKSPVTVADDYAVLLNGIESNQGVFQFVPRQKSWEVSGSSAGVDATESTPTVLGRLLHEFAKSREAAQPLTIGKYTVVGVQHLASSEAPDNPTDKPNFFQRYQLDVQWPADNGSTFRASVPLTQVGLRFTDQVLQHAELELAQNILTAHIAQIEGHSEPQIFSPGGIGRSATLMVHHEISHRIHAGLISDEDALHDQIEQVINKGREERSPFFVHSTAQFGVLQESLTNVFKQVQDSRHHSVHRAKTFPSAVIADAIAISRSSPAPAPIGSSANRPQAVDAQISRTNTVNQLTHHLSRAVVEKLRAIDALNFAHNNYFKDKFKLELGVGELLRLQQVLLDLKVQPLTTPCTTPARFGAMGKVVQDMLDYQTEIENVASTNITNRNEVGFSSRGASINATNRACENLLELTQLKGKVMRFINGDADTNVRDDEGNNCLLVSILQHASGDYYDHLHHDMAKILREGLVGMKRDQPDDSRIKYGEGLFDDEDLLKWVINTVNNLYGRDLQIHMVVPGFANSEQTVVTPGLHVDSEASMQGTEPILILKNNFHYEAIAPITQAAHRPSDAPSKSPAQIATESQQERNQQKPRLNARDIQAMRKNLENERQDAEDRITAIRAEQLITFNLSEVSEQILKVTAPDKLVLIKEIYANHAKNIRQEKMDRIASLFNERLLAFEAYYFDENGRSPFNIACIASNPGMLSTKSFISKLM